MGKSPATTMSCAPIVGDDGDDHELGEAFGTSFERAGDRLAGFGMGMVVFAAALAVLFLVRV